MSTFEHKLKCTSCGLHFTAFSWQSNWQPKGGCPECGVSLAKAGYLHWRDESTRQIYEFVPGSATLVGVGGDVH